MSTLTATDFFKEPTSSRPDRKQVFLKKYKNKEVFQIKNGNMVVFKYDKAIYDKVNSLFPGMNKEYNSIVLKTTDNKIYKITDIVKTKEFGGGSGSGAGAENTKLNESSVCLWAAIQQKYGNSQYQTVIQNVKNVKSLYDVDENDSNMISQSDQVWINHYNRTAEYIVNKIKPRGSSYTYHRGSILVDRINKKFSECNKKMESPFSNINKWTPADIWMVKDTFKLDLSEIHSIDDFNRYLLNNFNNKNLIGISLKKTLKTVSRKDYNVGETRPLMKFKGQRIMAPRGNIFSSKDIYIYAIGEDEISMQVRSFDDLSGYQGELIGKTAKYGKIALGPINMVLGDLGLEKLPLQPSVAIKARQKNSNLLKELYDTFSKYGEPGMSFKNFIAYIENNNVKSDWIFSKYLGVKLIDIIMSTTQKKRNDFVQGTLAYALSNSKNSAPFIKLY